MARTGKGTRRARGGSNGVTAPRTGLSRDPQVCSSSRPDARSLPACLEVAVVAGGSLSACLGVCPPPAPVLWPFPSRFPLPPAVSAGQEDTVTEVSLPQPEVFLGKPMAVAVCLLLCPFQCVCEVMSDLFAALSVLRIFSNGSRLNLKVGYRICFENA